MVEEKITVVIPTLILEEQGLKLTQNTVQSIGDFALIVIDNASPLGGGYLRSIADCYVRNNENLGYAKAVNQGLKLATTRLVAVANNDIRVDRNWYVETIAAFAQTPTIGTLHFRMTDYDVPFTRGTTLALTGKERWCTGSFFVLNKDTGLLFDEGFFNSYDDWDLGMRLRQGGWQTAYTDRSSYQHQHSHTQKLIAGREENNRRNAEYFRKKHGKYAEELFAEQYPAQMTADYWGGFSL